MARWPPAASQPSSRQPAPRSLVLNRARRPGAWIGNLTALEPLPSDLHRRCAHRTVFAWRRIFRPTHACKPGTCVCPQVRTAYNHLLDRGRPGSGSRSDFPSCPVLLNGVAMKNSLSLLALATTLSSRLGRRQDRHLVGARHDLRQACPITVKKAWSKVAGVEKAEVTFRSGKPSSPSTTRRPCRRLDQPATETRATLQHQEVRTPSAAESNRASHRRHDLRRAPIKPSRL